MIDCAFENGNKASLRHVVTQAIVEKDGKILLEKRAEHLLEGGKWGLPGGFLDRDETVEQGVLRELLEETGWTGKVIGLMYVNSDPARPKEDRQNIAFDFIVEPIEQVQQGDKESSEIAWFPLNNLPPKEMIAFDQDLTIHKYLSYKKTSFPIPEWK